MMSTRSTRAERVTYADVSAFQAAKEAYDSGEGHASEPAEVTAADSVPALILLQRNCCTSGLWHTKRKFAQPARDQGSTSLALWLLLLHGKQEIGNIRCCVKEKPPADFGRPAHEPPSLV